VGGRDEEEGHCVAELNTVVRAAGGVVWRRSSGAAVPDRRALPDLEIAVVHRPRYDDWSLPKGKLDPGEHRLAAAVREVFEETAVRAVPQARLPAIRYLTGQPGVEKVVDFWSMRAESWTERAPDHEIEAVRWIPAASAATVLSYAHDRGVVKAFLDLPEITSVVILIRHAKAGKRGEWPGPDDERPLDDTGVVDSRLLCELLALFHPSVVRSAAPRRCVETVAPLGLPVAVDPVFNEDSDPTAATAAVRELAGAGHVAVVCSQGDIIPPVLAELTARGNPRFATPKGSGWVLTFNGERLVTYDFL
jgi:8-oxo-dGTP diphosphatase